MGDNVVGERSPSRDVEQATETYLVNVSVGPITVQIAGSAVTCINFEIKASGNRVDGKDKLISLFVAKCLCCK